MWIGRVEFSRRSVGSTRQSRKLRMACSRVLQCFTEKLSRTLGDDGLRMREGAMESLVEEQVASSSDDVVHEHLRITSDEDSGGK